MRTTLLFAAILIGTIYLPVAAGESELICGYDTDRIGLRYRVEITKTVGEESDTGAYHVQIWRHGNQVAYVYEEQAMTEIWDLVSDGRQKLIRYFDAHQRAIEYQPEDIHGGSGKEAWSARYHLVSSEERDGLHQIGGSGDVCDSTIVFRSSENDHIEIEWRPVFAAPAMLRRSEADKEIVWTLDETIADGSRVDAEFSRRHHYVTTDFVDIGDNESDPFLTQMMHLGFIEDGHSH